MAAYNKRYNPDALPAHVEPEQAAQMLSQRTPSSQADPRPQRTDSYGSKPPPPPPQNVRTDDRSDRYGRREDYRSPTNARPSGGWDEYDRRQEGGRHGSNYDGGYNDGRPRQDSYSSSRYNYDSQQGGGGYGPSRQSPPTQAGRPPPTPAPPRDGNDRDALWPMFRAVDKDRKFAPETLPGEMQETLKLCNNTGTGQLSEQELGRALVNGDYTSFDPHTVKMMIRMFDVDRSGTISFDEFCGLWGFLSEWRKLFDRFDADRSGTISFDEFQSALVAFGYRLSPEYVHLLFTTYDTRGRGALSFDLFVQSCISLKRMTDVFKKYDTDRDGYITLSFEQFLTGAQSLFLFNSISPVTDKGLY